MQAGACFGLSAACCRTGFLLAGRLSWLAAPAGLGMSIIFSSLGFMLQTLGFKDGHSVIVCTCAAVSSMVTGVSTSHSHPSCNECRLAIRNSTACTDRLTAQAILGEPPMPLLHPGRPEHL